VQVIDLNTPVKDPAGGTFLATMCAYPRPGWSAALLRCARACCAYCCGPWTTATVFCHGVGIPALFPAPIP
jgi:hypothetical protein